MTTETKTGKSDQTGTGRFRPSLQTKFLVSVAVIFLGVCGVMAYLIYIHERNLLMYEAEEKARLVMGAVDAARSYVREELRPTMYRRMGKDAFVLEAMSTSYVGRSVMDRFRKVMPEYRYRRVAVDARNPEYEANPFEKKMIRYFAGSPNKKNWQGIVKIAGSSAFVHSRPVYFTDSCLRCHGKPADAPKAMLDIYGRKRGFGRTLGEVGGLSTVSIPVDVALAKIKERAFAIFGTAALVLSVLFALTAFLFNRVVVGSLKDLLGIFRGGLRDEKSRKLLDEAEAKDEIGELQASARVLFGHLQDSREQLQAYARNLEAMVAERTRELEASQERLREKVDVRNRELQALNVIAELITRAENLKGILPRVLQQTLTLIPAEGAGLYLIRNDPPRLELEYHENAPNLGAAIPFDEKSCLAAPRGEAESQMDSLQQAACGHMSLFPCRKNNNCLNVPLSCRDEVRGVMTFAGVDFAEVTDEMRALLQSIGRQIGITVESLQNMEAILHSHNLLRSIFDGITDMMIMLDRNRRIIMVNKAYLDYFGTAADQVVDRNCLAPHEDGVCPYSDCGLDRVFETGRPLTEEVQSKRGETFRVQFFPILDESGEVESVVRYSRDITVERDVERRIQQTEKLASIGQLAAGIAHEINNPLGVILMYADLIKRQMAEFPQGLSDLATIEKHAGNARRIVSDLLKFARGEETELKVVDLHPALEEVAGMIARQVKRRQLEVEVSLDPRMPRLNLDVERMKQVYLNLLMNARQAMNDRGRIWITTQYAADAGEARIEFRDNGPGISEELIDRIFDPFFSTKKAGEGTGLGLSVSYGIIRDHGGDIRVESREGAGTRFTIVLPVPKKESV